MADVVAVVVLLLHELILESELKLKLKFKIKAECCGDSSIMALALDRLLCEIDGKMFSKLNFKNALDTWIKKWKLLRFDLFIYGTNLPNHGHSYICALS